MYYLVEKHKRVPKNHYVIIGYLYYKHNDELCIKVVECITGKISIDNVLYALDEHILDKDRSLKKLKERIAISLL